MQVVGGVTGALTNLYTQYERNGENLNLDNINFVELLINTGAGIWSGGATSLGGAAIRGGVSSVATEAYNQSKYNKNGVDTKSIVTQGLFGSSIGLASGAAGLAGKNIIKKSGIIGRPINEPLKTYEYELGGTVGFGAAALKSYIENKKEDDKKWFLY